MSPDPIPPYASTRLIAYIGNKRALLPLLRSVFLELQGEAPVSTFLDPFAGSGSVSRLARCLGYRVMANDAEAYSFAVNACWLGISALEEPSLFAAEGGVEAVLARINRFHPQREDEAPPGGEAEPYIARHYAPASTVAADWRRERLFYTRENAVFLDRARSYADRLRPDAAEIIEGSLAARERALLVGSLVYEAATHANTSGVFKACHKGFGGHGGDALKRIMAPMRLEPPLLWPLPPAELGLGDAAGFCASRCADLCYLDPPYNQHQYGSNYHLLNTVARWDREPVSEERHPDGALAEKAGIPSRWRESRSAFCSRREAPRAFRGLLDAVDARAIVLSYSSEAIVSPEELYDLLDERAEVELRSVDYVKYRGGRQSAARLGSNRELLFIARARPGRRAVRPRDEGAASPARASSTRRDEGLAGLAADVRLARALSSALDPRTMRPLADPEGRLAFRSASGPVYLPTYRLLAFGPEAARACASLASEDKEALAALIEPGILSDNGKACEACIDLIESGCGERRLQDLALRRLRKIAHRKYGPSFEAAAARLAAAAEAGGLSRLSGQVAALVAVYEARRAGESRRRPIQAE